MNIIRSIINFFGFNNVIVDGIGERGMRDSSIIRYNEVHDMYDKIIKDLGDMSAYVSKGYIYDKIKDKTGFSTRHISRILNHTKKRDLRFIWHTPITKANGILGYKRKLHVLGQSHSIALAFSCASLCVTLTPKLIKYFLNKDEIIIFAT